MFTHSKSGNCIPYSVAHKLVGCEGDDARELRLVDSHRPAPVEASETLLPEGSAQTVPYGGLAPDQLLLWTVLGSWMRLE